MIVVAWLALHIHNGAVLLKRTVLHHILYASTCITLEKHGENAYRVLKSPQYGTMRGRRHSGPGRSSPVGKFIPLNRCGHLAQLSHTATSYVHLVLCDKREACIPLRDTLQHLCFEFACRSLLQQRRRTALENGAMPAAASTLYAAK